MPVRPSLRTRDDASTERRKELLQLLDGRRTAVLIQLERLRITDGPPFLLAIQLQEQPAILIRDVSAPLLDAFDEERLPSGLVGGNIRAGSRLPRIGITELRRHRRDTVPLLLCDLVDADGDDRVERIRLEEWIRIEEKDRIAGSRRRVGTEER